MKTIFLESNAINKVREKNISGIALKNMFDEKRFTPVVNIHTIYELARTFLNEETSNVGVELFSLIHELKPVFTCETKTLLSREISKLRYDKGVDFLIDSNIANQNL